MELNALIKKLALLSLLAAQSPDMHAQSLRKGLPFLGDGVTNLTAGQVSAVDMILLRDSVDPDLYYVPYDRLTLASEDDVPQFGFSYTVDGALMSFTVQPGYDRQAYASIRKRILSENPKARFVPLPLTEGAYSLTIKSFDGESVVQAGEAIVHSSLGNPWSTTLSFRKETADILVTALKTGAVLGINFRYNFKAATLPSAVRVVLDKERILNAFSSAPYQTQASMLNKVQTLQTQSSLRIISIGDNAPLEYAMIFVSNFILDHCFAPIGNSVLGEGYRFDRQVCSNGLQNDITITNSSVLTVTATAGMSIGALCNAFPSHFAYQGPENQIRNGCPDRTLPDTLSELNSQSFPGQLTYQRDERIPDFPAIVFENL